MSRSGNKNSYFSQIAMPHATGLPVLRPARRYPTRPGEERVAVEPVARQSKPVNIADPKPLKTNPAPHKTESRIATRKDSVPELAVTSENFQSRVPTIEPRSETVVSMSEPEDVDNIAVIDRQPVKQTDDSDSRNLSIVRDRSEFVNPAALNSDESQPLENLDKSPRAIQSIMRGENESDDLESDLFFEQTTRSTSPNRESRASVLRDRQPTRTSAMNNDRQPANIHIGSIEVRVVNPAPVPPPVVQNRPQIPSPVQSLRNGAGGQSSGKLARAFRGPFGLRQE